ncbi:MAG TPA: hypothetical protein VLJ61_08270, partial [Pyrinomonadaceae bacterium]|nr:hypothetical protein [Pyrinomonadaceae bacterium]
MFSTNSRKKSPARGANGERGGALAIAMIVLALIAVIAVSVLATVSNEARISGSDLRRTQTCYVADAKIEKMTSDFSAIFSRTSHPSSTDLNTVRTSDPTELLNEGFTFPNPVLGEDTTKLYALQDSKGITDRSIYPQITIPNGPYAGLSATIDPYKVQATAQHNVSGVQCVIERDVNNYLIPLFQFGMFSDKDIELHPGADFFFNGRVHANGNIYVAGLVKFLDKVTTANELVTDVMRNGNVKPGTQVVSMQVGSINVPLTKGSVNNGPNFTGATQGKRGYFPTSPNGTPNAAWDTTSVAAATSGVSNQFGGQLQTRTTGAAPLLLPLQLDGNPTREIIKRMLPTDSTVLNESRYNNKAEVRILLDDGSVPAGSPGSIPVDSGGNKKGVDLATWVPTRLGKKVLHRFNDAGNDLGSDIQQANTSGSGNKTADAVRGANAV